MRKVYFISVLAMAVMIGLLFHSSIPSAFAQKDESLAGSTAQEKLKLELMEEFKKKEEELVKKEETIRRREDRVRSMELELGKKIDELERLQVRVDELIKMRDDVEEKNISLLSKTYSDMAPEEAAARLKEMDRLIALKILVQMKSKKSARVLESLEPQVASEMSEQLAKRRLPK